MSQARDIGERVILAQHRHRWTQMQLAEASGVAPATIRRIVGGQFSPRLETARKLADALSVRIEWLLTGDEPMLMLGNMTPDEQHRAQTGPGTEGLPGYVVGRGGPWYRDEAGEWQIDARFVRDNGGRHDRAR